MEHKLKIKTRATQLQVLLSHSHHHYTLPLCCSRWNASRGLYLHWSHGHSVGLSERGLVGENRESGAIYAHPARSHGPLI